MRFDPWSQTGWIDLELHGASLTEEQPLHRRALSFCWYCPYKQLTYLEASVRWIIPEHFRSSTLAKREFQEFPDRCSAPSSKVQETIFSNRNEFTPAQIQLSTEKSLTETTSCGVPFVCEPEGERLTALAFLARFGSQRQLTKVPVITILPFKLSLMQKIYDQRRETARTNSAATNGRDGCSQSNWRCTDNSLLSRVRVWHSAQTRRMAHRKRFAC